ncbi:hypothetical protein A3J19_02155 [Candidatus Daviesbacteria bacterium RIFCSPLOWO2_02_FULL_41_8]|uniref:Uncharacterized protein n=3 Tax=Candidatus Daviesiibacteriota TaxID=1752718 RepID=A0A1F5NI53_9BACT|nr:MAG: hypothetical protein A2871_01155 [Candidatus Daviesbacteria bacterium RIFCSPHIGHO2_01_FULL_41_23]OGE32651.1 MAG: hypothetical protein A3D83_01520 [Candidatus Daviesbacteria bacterium RIFCSPHIGHO2_02_FULL_41_10]OGE62503.1 MAG: hypothetical protein A2967_01640 [Candidatus Daviesbacteria bacterium RIFCSPLOWO2_01_FULL_41_32]OGE77100.1 MAG: hypothetical protein A3J19_02155 [Candidatus Daviesbacteria bacterium RIFCSPLOWO2_02_FULL_41_8]
MIIYLFSSSILGLVIGNIVGLIKKITKKEEKAIWISRPFYKYTNFKDYPFLILWCIIAISGGYFGSSHPEFKDSFAYYIGIFLLVTGILFFLRLPHALDRLHFYGDRLEEKFLLHTTLTIPFSSIKSIFRDGQNFAKIAYHDKTFGLVVFNEDKPWKIPLNIFSDPRFESLSSKLHRSDTSYGTLDSDQKVSWKNTCLINKILMISILFINPYSLLIGSVFLFGIFFTSPLLFLLTDFSRVYCSFAFKLLRKRQDATPKINGHCGGV